MVRRLACSCHHTLYDTVALIWFAHNTGLGSSDAMLCQRAGGWSAAQQTRLLYAAQWFV